MFILVLYILLSLIDDELWHQYTVCSANYSLSRKLIHLLIECFLHAFIETDNMFSIATGNAKRFTATVLNAIDHYSIAIVTLSWCFDRVCFAIDWFWVTMKSLHFFIFANKEFNILKRLTSSTELEKGLFLNILFGRCVITF